MSLKGRRVVVTGAGGFIGSHLIEALVAEDARVHALVHYNSRNDWGELERIPAETREKLEVMAGDVRDPFLVDRLVAGADTVFHLAALIPIPYSYIAPAEFVDTNIKGTMNVLEAARRHQTRRVVHTSTSETYGTAITVPITEQHPLQGQSPYSASKIGADKIAESYERSFGTPVVTIRPFNTYGPRQSARAFLPAVLTQALTRDEVRVGSLDPVRDMNYVSDIVAGFLAAATAEKVEGLTLNLGSGRGVTMSELLEMALAVTGRKPRVVTEQDRVRPERSEVRVLIADASQAHQRLGWSSKVPLEEGVRRTAEWVAAHLDRYKPGLYNV